MLRPLTLQRIATARARVANLNNLMGLGSPCRRGEH
jgi:hypothetical protein